jgi:prepilin-type N-terminal cleavage/methylation domain-containing protein
MIAVRARNGLKDRLARVSDTPPGFTLIEVLVAIVIFGVIALIAVPHMDARRMQINTAYTEVIANLRVARSNAITKSVHYQVEFPSVSEVRLERMKQDVSGNWQTDDTNVQTVTLPSETTLSSSVIGKRYEFNTRGMAVNIAEPQQIDLKDAYGVARSIKVWPSGQVNGL